MPAFGYSSDARLLEGPVPNGGGHGHEPRGDHDKAPAAGKQAVVDVIDNTTGATLEKCTIPAGQTHCSDSSSTPVAAGHYLEVRIDPTTTALPAAWRVTFRY